uniref:Uncharacterized protein n=1 Tax=Glossina austeni TaxID=7395 RepID=A0A1A9UUI8_GLOAU
MFELCSSISGGVAERPTAKTWKDAALKAVPEEELPRPHVVIDYFPKEKRKRCADEYIITSGGPSISPAMVETEMVGEHLKRLAKDCILSPHDISNAILYALSTPPHVQIHDMIIKSVGDLF